jgi:hypothetical protein
MMMTSLVGARARLLFVCLLSYVEPGTAPISNSDSPNAGRARRAAAIVRALGIAVNWNKGCCQYRISEVSPEITAL